MGKALKNGVLIVLEGIDGSGKSTQLRLLADWLTGLGYDVVTSREPTDSVHGRRTKVIADLGREGLTPRQELDLYIEDRREHVKEFIRPALDAGKIVILDRYYLSTMGYQGALGLNPEMIRRENESFAPIPDLILLFDIIPEEGLGRISSGRSGGTNEGYEQEEYLTRVREIMNRFEAPCLRHVDAAGSVEEVAGRVRALVDEFLIRTNKPGESA